MKIKKLFIYLLLPVLLFTLVSCNKNDDSKLLVVASMFPQYDVVRSIGGDKVDLLLTISPGVDTHSYDPSVDDIINIKKANLFIYVSNELETWANGLKKEDDSHLVLNLSKNENITLQKSEEHEHEDEDHEEEEHKHEYDPHIWTSPQYLIYIVQDIRDALVKLDSDNKDYYEANAAAYIAELESIIVSMNELKERAGDTTFYFASPFAFLYLFNDFNLSYYTIYDTCTTEIEPTMDKILALKALIVEENIKYVYVKELSSSSVAETIVDGTDCQILLLHSGHNLTSTDFKNGVTLLGLMKQNIENLNKGI